jgi:ADP-ribose pyrophosphatase
VVLPYDPVRDEVVLVEQFRISAYARGVKPWLIECIAGRVGKDEAPEEVAVREAREEADCAVVDLIQIGGMFISPGMIAEYVTMFCARCDSSTVGGVHGLDDEHEDIRVMAVPFEAALAALEQGRILTSPAFVCLNWLARNRDNLKRRWIEPR